MRRTLILSMAMSSLASALMTLVLTLGLSPRAAEAQVPAPPLALQYKSVAAEQFVLQGADGTVRARLGFDATGSPGIFLIDRNGTTRARFNLDPDENSSLALLDPDGTRRVTLAVNAASDSLVILRQPGAGAQANAPLRLRLAVRGNGATALDVLDSDGARVWIAP